MGISFDKSGNMYVADTENNRVQVLKKNGQFSHVIGSGQQGSGKGELSYPTDTGVDSHGRVKMLLLVGKFIMWSVHNIKLFSS